MKNFTASQQSRPALIREMFDRIAPTYDLLNRLISFGLDRPWRAKAIGLLARHPGGTYLDIAAGSGDVTLSMLDSLPGFVVGTDFSINMLGIFREKLRSSPRGGSAGLAAADALRLPFRDGSFDGTIVAFGIRNFADRPLALREMYRVLKPGGTSVILELTVPPNPVIAAFYRVHARVVLPVVGKIISGDASAYRYLPDSIEGFPASGTFLRMMGDSGFVRSGAVRLSFGSATIFHGEKP
jgi:demethylmenaquinone methyltransferase/2-methoxy-6-polyprenyl-1,4-benzoquinol methylase